MTRLEIYDAVRKVTRDKEVTIVNLFGYNFIVTWWVYEPHYEIYRHGQTVQLWTIEATVDWLHKELTPLGMGGEVT